MEDKYTALFIKFFTHLESLDSITAHSVQKLLKQYPKPTGGVFSKDVLVQAYRQLAGTHGLQPEQPRIIRALRMKPTRTISGVVPVTVLTKPFPCPGKCIFCPNDVRMPKSYLSDEPGAQRAERNWFDPYLQTYNRLQALYNIGHSVDKAELIILGGTWSYYPESYQIWFITECFRALSDFGVANLDDRVQIMDRYAQIQLSSAEPEENEKKVAPHKIDGEYFEKSYNQTVSELYVAPEKRAGVDALQTATWDELIAQHTRNETAAVRCVGLVVETRPDNISEQEVLRMRRLGCTKTQIGIQSLQDEVLEKNKRGHKVAEVRNSVALLRRAGFKIHAHWMANLYGSSVEQDKNDYTLLFSDPDFKPDELKIYPCSLIQSAELMQYYKAEKWRPYSHDELLDLLQHCLLETPEYCRLTRVIRDISSDDIVVGNKKTNFRQIVEQSLEKSNKHVRDIRSREIRGEQFDANTVRQSSVQYQTAVSTEHFIQLTGMSGAGARREEKILGFVRLSLPKTEDHFIAELAGAAIIRELHVYGSVQALGSTQQKAAQHRGFGTQLLAAAQKIAAGAGYRQLAVISAIGTKEYYRKKGFTDGQLYQFFALDPSQIARE